MTALELVVDAEGLGQLTLDGKPLQGVAGLHISVNAGGPVKAVLELNVMEMLSLEVEGPEIIVPATVAETLVLLGWTPPIAESAAEQDRLDSGRG